MNWKHATLLFIIVLVIAFKQLAGHDPLSILEETGPVRRLATAHKEATPPPARPARPPAARKETLLDWLEQDRFCTVMKTALEDGENRQLFLRSLHLLDEEPYREWVSDDGPYYRDPGGREFKSEAARFIQALQLSGQMEPAGVAKLDYESADMILQSLQREDPFNGAYPYFRLVVDAALKKPLDERLRTVDDLLSTRRFETHYMHLYRTVLDRMSANASKFLAGISYLSTLPMPNYLTAAKLVHQLDTERPGLSEKLADLMTEPALEATYAQDLGGYSVLEYSVGRSFSPSRAWPAWKELDEKKVHARGDFSTFPVFDPARAENLKCDDSVQAEFYAYLRNWR